MQSCTQGPHQQRRSPPVQSRRRLPSPRRKAGYFRVTSLAFWGVHVAAVVGIIAAAAGPGRAPRWRSARYFVRMIVVTAAYHRYFSHRSFKTSRAFQFLLALGAQSAAQKGVLWWAGHHRWHHKYSDTPKDVHSARRAASGTRTSAGSWARTGNAPIARWSPTWPSSPSCASSTVRA